MTADLVILPLRHGPFWNVTYLVGSRAAGEALVVDPAWDVDAVLARAAQEGLRVRAAVLTHAHDDHAHGLEALVRATGAETVVHHRDTADLRALYTGPVTRIEDGHELHLGSLRVRLLHTPGHTPGSQSLLVDGALFTGDTLLAGTLGRAGPEPDAQASLWHTVSRVLALLPDTTAIYPGHDTGPRSVSTLGIERAADPRLRARTFEEFLAYPRRL
jgi:glyoxylase-like metal-dependent hydrolase (beta-lactamase superfamily II)